MLKSILYQLFFGVTHLGKQIFPVSSAKDMGVTLDSCQSYKENVTDVASKCI